MPAVPPTGGIPGASGTGDASNWLDLKGLAEMKAAAGQQKAGTIRAVAQQFESVFLGMMMKSMRDAKLGDGAFDSDESKLYKEMFDNQVALNLSKGRGLGIADMLVRQLDPTAKVSPAAPAAPAATRVRAFPHVAPAAPATAPAAPRLAAMPATPAGVAGVPTARADGFASALDGSLPGLDPVAGGLPAVADVPALAQRRAAAAYASNAAPAPAPAATAGAGHAHGRRFAETPEEFVRKVLPHAQAAAAALGVPAEAIVAQAALETGWGRSVPASGGAGHNLFGIKAGADWGGARLTRTTYEVDGGRAVRTADAFKGYESVAHGFEDYVSLLRNSPRYGALRAAGADPVRFAQALQAGGYATDPHYAQKLTRIMNGSTLRDALAAVTGGGASLAAAAPPPAAPVSVAGEAATLAAELDALKTGFARPIT
jgi:flagellar protein FlgJ